MKASPLFSAAVQDPYGAQHSTLHGANNCFVYKGATMHKVQCQKQLKKKIYTARAMAASQVRFGITSFF